MQKAPKLCPALPRETAFDRTVETAVSIMKRDLSGQLGADRASRVLDLVTQRNRTVLFNRIYCILKQQVVN